MSILLLILILILIPFLILILLLLLLFPWHPRRAAIGIMFRMGYSGALPAAAFSALGGLVGWLTGRAIVLVALRK